MAKKTALFIRMDRMGDLVLTLPCDHRVQDSYDVHWLIPKGLEFVVESARPKKSFTPFEKQWSSGHFFSLIKVLRKLKPDVAVTFHVPWWFHLALWLTGVKTRGGVLSQWHSYLFLNKGLRQKRSRCEHHEMDYNYLLVEHCFNLSHDPKLWSHQTLKEPDSVDLPVDEKLSYFVVHPGMGGSALNWPTSHYKELIDQLTEKAHVVITGTRHDKKYLDPLKKQLNGNHKVVWLDSQLQGVQLLKLLKHSIALIAPSTGVLHLGASLGVASLGVYSPIQVHQAKRWGPKGPKAQSFMPEVTCPAQFECQGSQCSDFFCMDKMATKLVAESALSLF